MSTQGVRTLVVAMAGVVLLTGAMQSTQPSSRPAAQADAGEGLPTGWLGDWAGSASLSAPGRPPRNFKMELHVAPTDSRARFKWTIVYAEGGQRQERPYELIVKDAAKGLFEVDEKNSIRLPMVLLNGGFYSSFEVEGATLNAMYRLEEPGTASERIVVEIVSLAGAADPTGGGDGAPEVRTRVPGTLQRAVLRRAAHTETQPGKR